MAPRLPVSVEIERHVGTALAAVLPPQLPSVSVIQPRAQPNYARLEPSRKVLRRKSRITIFAELTDKLAEARGHIWRVVKQAPQTFPYLSPNGLIMLCVNVQFTHASIPMARDCPSGIDSLLS
jgi:hypothetical protein